MDFVVATPKARSVSRLAFEYARKNGLDESCRHKSERHKNDRRQFLSICNRNGCRVPGDKQRAGHRYMTAKVIDEERRRDFRVFILRSLRRHHHREAAQFQGGSAQQAALTSGKNMQCSKRSTARAAMVSEDVIYTPSLLDAQSGVMCWHIGMIAAPISLPRRLIYVCSPRRRSL